MEQWKRRRQKAGTWRKPHAGGRVARFVFRAAAFIGGLAPVLALADPAYDSDALRQRLRASPPKQVPLASVDTPSIATLTAPVN